ncbi:hyaluronoglucuronidase-like [Littorina saxatilis]|uniref:hyaluronoglucuronidase-like n=1 Tax=Littorina saxatilis TaxID=31220 RepID=UPI0038B5E387
MTVTVRETCTSLILIGLCSASRQVYDCSQQHSYTEEEHIFPRDDLVGEPVTVLVNLQQSVNQISSHFVGVTIDAALIHDKWRKLDFSSKRVQNMAKALTPSFFRLGGTSADSLTYVLYNGQNSTPPTQLGSHVPANLTAEAWETINEFTKEVGWDLIFDLNALKRNADGSWNHDNARQLLQFSADRNYTIAGFELGNEYDIYERKHNATLSPRQLAKDVMTLQTLLSQFPQYYSAFIIGPETATDNQQCFQGFLAAGGSKVVSAASFHHYYYSDEDEDVSRFTDIKTMDSFDHILDHVMDMTRSVNPQLPVWLSETSCTYDHGVANVSDRFVAGFLWLDKLGLCALNGVQTVIRQDFYGNNYSFLNPQQEPNPDFWLTVLYKRIVRGAVFNATGRHDVRVYAACANSFLLPAGSVVVYTLNPDDYPLTFDLPQFQTQPRMLWSLTGWGGDRLSKYTSLNGVKLELVNDELPDLPGKLAPPGVVTVPPYSFTFVAFYETSISICYE